LEVFLSEVTKVCFVCLGNIVRSPFAENMFRYLVNEAGLSDNYEIDSAGTSAWHVGEKPDRRMRQVASSHGFEYSGRARQFKSRDFDRFDMIIAMDNSNRNNLLGMTGKPDHRRKIYQMRAFDPEGGADMAVPDPYYGGIDGFEVVYQIVERSCRGLLEALESGKLE
jgi:protein-tyrosine phosphatase